MARERLDAVARSDVALHLDGEVVAGAAAGEEPLDHVLAAEAKPELVAGQPGLGDDELGGADAEAVADRDLLLERQPLDREVLAEGAERQLLPELLPPEGVVLERVGVDRLRGAAVDGEVGLAVAVEVQATERDATLDRLLEDAGCHVASLPAHGAREADVDRDDSHDVHRGSCGLPDMSLDRELRWPCAPPSVVLERSSRPRLSRTFRRSF